MANTAAFARGRKSTARPRRAVQSAPTSTKAGLAELNKGSFAFLDCFLQRRLGTMLSAGGRKRRCSRKRMRTCELCGKALVLAVSHNRGFKPTLRSIVLRR